MSSMMDQPDAQPGDCSHNARVLLALTMVPGLGPVRILNLCRTFEDPSKVLGASVPVLSRVPGIGAGTANSLARNLPGIYQNLDREIDSIARAGASIVSIMDPGYPPLLKQIPSPPPILMIKGRFDHHQINRYTIAIVGSRSSSIYGHEQASRFSSALASAGLTIISGGARGIDTAAHRGALQVDGQTSVVLGCGIGKVYPPENERIFEEIVDHGGSIISELPLNAVPDAKNFPARNRIISGLSLGVLVVEAGLKSGSLITARVATEDQGREVMAIPGRIDSPSSAGTHELLKQGAHLVTDPSDVISILERDAFHLHAGSHRAKTSNFERPVSNHPKQGGSLADLISNTPSQDDLIGEVDDETRALLMTLSEPRTCDEIAETMGIDPGSVRSKMTMLEIQGRVRRSGSRFERT